MGNRGSIGLGNSRQPVSLMKPAVSNISFKMKLTGKVAGNKEITSLKVLQNRRNQAHKISEILVKSYTREIQVNIERERTPNHDILTELFNILTRKINFFCFVA